MRPWQEAAFQAWIRAGRRGVVAAATGTGKTRVALEAIASTEADRVVVVVPTSVLQEQWGRGLRAGFGLSSKLLGTIGGRHPEFTFDNTVTVAIINSARERLARIMAHWRGEGRRVLLVVDECHWAGSETSGGLFQEPPEYALGLSATPERSDDGFEELMVPNLGDVVYRFPLRAAVDAGVLSEIVSSHFLFALTSTEQRETDRLTDRIRGLRADISRDHPELDVGPGWEERLARLALDDEASHQLQRLLKQRRSQVATAAGRIDCFIRVVASGYLDGRHVIVFNETIAQADRIAAELRALGQAFALEHSGLASSQRETALNRFASEAVPVLVAVRALDEGLDIAAANVAVIVSGSLNARKRIQRIGRIARPSATSAEVLSILARNSAEETETTILDSELLGPGRVRRIDLEAFR